LIIAAWRNSSEHRQRVKRRPGPQLNP
jgi:hypothetical protein